MKSRMYTRILIAVVTAGFLAACSAASQDDKKAQLEDLKKQQADISKQILAIETELAKTNPDSTSVKMKEVIVTEVKTAKFDHSVQTQGSVEAEDNILVSAKTMGVVNNVFVTEGQQVSRGQVLAQIDNGVMKQNVEGIKAQLELANTVFERQKNLWSQKIGTEVQYLQAKTNKEALERQLASAQEQLDMAKITSPISGTIDEVYAKTGESLPGPAFRVVNTSNLKLKANVSEAYVTDIKKGNKVIVSIPELKKDVTAEVTFVGKTIDPLSRTFPIEIKLKSLPDLRPNMTGVIKVIFKSEASVVTLPVNVVQDINKEKVVYVAEMSGKQLVARKRVVKVNAVYENVAQVDGLKPGEKVITFGFQGLNDGQAIKL